MKDYGPKIIVNIFVFGFVVRIFIDVHVEFRSGNCDAGSACSLLKIAIVTGGNRKLLTSLFYCHQQTRLL